MPYTYFGCFLTLPCMREMSVAEQRYKAVQAVISNGRPSCQSAIGAAITNSTREFLAAPCRKST
jgi:hypothetical protein